MTVRAEPVPGVNCVPVKMAVGGVAVAAESGIVVEPGLVNLGETQRSPQRPGDPAGPGSVDGDTVAVPGGGTGGNEMPFPDLRSRRMPACMKPGSFCHLAGICPGATISTRAETSPQTAHSEVTTIG